MQELTEGSEEAGGTPAARPTRWLVGGLVVLAYCLATVVMTWPFAAHLGSMTPGEGDPLLQIWAARWVQHALVTKPLQLFDANIFYPHTNTLAYSDANVPAALLAAPFYLLTGNPILAVNLLVLGTFVLAATGVYALVTLLVQNRAIAFLAGLAYAFLPYRFAHLWHLNQLGHAWTPWVVVALLLLIRQPSWWRACLFGFLVAVQAVTSFYVAFQVVLVVGLVLVAALLLVPGVRTWRFGALLAVSGLVALCIILPLALPYLRVSEEQGFERTVQEAESFQASPAAYLRVTPENRLWGWLTSPTMNFEDVLFPGAVACCGALLGLAGWRRRPVLTVLALALALIAFVIALGPTWRPDQGGTTPLPYRFLFAHFPFFKAMRVPARFGVLVDFAVILLASSGAEWAWGRLKPRLPTANRQLIGAALTAILAVAILVDLYAAPPVLQTIDQSAEAAAPYTWLAAQPDNGAVMELPIGISRQTSDSDAGTALAMFWSTLSWKPLIQGYSGFAPRGYADSMLLYVSDLPRPNGSVATNISYLNDQNITVLQELGVRYLVLHKAGYKREDWPLVLSTLEATGQATQAADFDQATIYTLRERDPATPSPEVNLALVAPTTVQPGQFWEPTVIVHNAPDRFGLVSRSRPLQLRVTWRNDSGQQVRADQFTLNLPGIVPPGDLYCSLRLCPAASGVNAPPPTAGQPTLNLYPDKPGHYTVQLDLTGDYTVSRTLTVDVTTKTTPAATDGPPLAFAGATPLDSSYSPGQAVAVTFAWDVRQRPSADYTLFAQLIGPDGKVWGQHDAPAGWTSHYTAQWSPGEQVSLPWLILLQPDAPPGDYQLIVGMYRHTPTGVERIHLGYPEGEATETVVGGFTVR